jgi:hypothetical protein
LFVPTLELLTQFGETTRTQVALEGVWRVRPGLQLGAAGHIQRGDVGAAGYGGFLSLVLEFDL